MAMPRYRYAIGQAPVRFPSPAPSVHDNEDKENDAHATNHQSIADTSSRPKRWSTAHGSEEASTSHRQSEKGQRDARDDRRRTKSMYDAKEDSSQSKLLSPNPQSSQLSPKPSLSSLRTTGSNVTQKSDATINERTPLQPKNSDMVQRQARPASTSVSSTIRPSSLFWTDYEAEQHQTSTAMPKSKSSYGAMERISTRNEDDPYGYRAMAGPALLPSFHEQQLLQQKEREAQSRTCGPTIVMLKKKKWLFTALFGVVIIVGGVLFIL